METTHQKETPRVYAARPFDRGAKVKWLLTEMGIKYDNVWIDRDKNGFEDPTFLKLNPMGRVPVLEIQGQAMSESGGICAYLADLHLDRGMAPALNSPDRAKYQQWMYFASATVDVFQTRIMIIEDIPEGAVHTDKLKALQSDIRDAMVALDAVLAKSQFLVANKFSAADICVSYHLYWLNLWPELAGVLKNFPRVGSYINRMKETPSAIKAEVFSYKE